MKYVLNLKMNLNSIFMRITACSWQWRRWTILGNGLESTEIPSKPGLNQRKLFKDQKWMSTTGAPKITSWFETVSSSVESYALFYLNSFQITEFLVILFQRTNKSVKQEIKAVINLRIVIKVTLKIFICKSCPYKRRQNSLTFYWLISLPICK